jgi:hypothetical protein
VANVGGKLSELGSVRLPRPSKNQYQYDDENNCDPPSKSIKTGIILSQEQLWYIIENVQNLTGNPVKH